MTSTYPVRVDGTLDTHLSRGLWLVKWALAIPHYIVLAFLWMAFAVLSVVAFFAILFTGRYPRAIFEFNVGVLRWSWRVAYYAYGALGTDKYPPFSLEERADYPAHLEIDYPEHLSRGLVLVKWWLLAIPHYLVVALLGGSGLWVAWETAGEETSWAWNTGLIGLLVTIAAVVLLFTGRYPRGIFDLVLGLNRWVIRVAAYAGLMTDQYPPFRLDMGPDDPGTHHLAVATRTAPQVSPTQVQAGPSAPVTGSRWTTGRVVAVTFGSFLLLLSGGFILGGIGTLVADSSMREDGFLVTGEETFTTSSYAITTESMEFHIGQGAEWVPESLLGDVRLTAAGGDPSSPVFLGVAETADVEAYLSGTSYSTLTDYESDSRWSWGGRWDGTPVYREHAGTAGPSSPESLDIWAAQASGTGEQVLTWAPTDGDWTVVLMNADATTGVQADVTAGAELPVLDWVGPVLLSIGGTMLVIGVVLVATSLIGGRKEVAP